MMIYLLLINLIIFSIPTYGLFKPLIKHPQALDTKKREYLLSEALWKNFIHQIITLDPTNTQPIRAASGIWTRSPYPQLQENYNQKTIVHKNIMQYINQLDSLEEERVFLDDSISNWSIYLNILHESNNEYHAFEKLCTLILCNWEKPKNQHKFFVTLIEESFKEIDISSTLFFKTMQQSPCKYWHLSSSLKSYAPYTSFTPKPTLMLYTKMKTFITPNPLPLQIETVQSALQELNNQIREIQYEQKKIIDHLSQSTEGFL